MPGTQITLPLFPLNTVLFPGMTLPLRIFERRYVQMMHDCLEGDPVFGVLLIKEGLEVGEAAVPHEVGTTARILSVERTSADELHIVTLGEERFLLHGVSHDKPYLVGDVEPFPLEGTQSSRVEALFDAELVLLMAYLELVSQANGVDIQLQQAVKTPTEMAYLVAALLQVPLATKQQLLATADLGALMERQVALLQAEITGLTVMLRGEQLLQDEDSRDLAKN
jgi:Lon protease-like protein